MRTLKIICAACIITTSIFLVGCSEKEFNPYDHMTRIMTMTKKEQFENDRELILGHTVEDLQAGLESNLNGTIYDDKYSINERNVYIEKRADTVKIIAEYDCTSSVENYMLVAYFEYQQDILVKYNVHKQYYNTFQ